MTFTLLSMLWVCVCVCNSDVSAHCGQCDMLHTRWWHLLHGLLPSPVSPGIVWRHRWDGGGWEQVSRHEQRQQQCGQTRVDDEERNSGGPERGSRGTWGHSPLPQLPTARLPCWAGQGQASVLAPALSTLRSVIYCLADLIQFVVLCQGRLCDNNEEVIHV